MREITRNLLFFLILVTVLLGGGFVLVFAVNLNRTFHLQYDEYGRSGLEIHQKTIRSFLETIKRHHNETAQNSILIDSVIRESSNKPFLLDTLENITIGGEKANHTIYDFEGSFIISTNELTSRKIAKTVNLDSLVQRILNSELRNHIQFIGANKNNKNSKMIQLSPIKYLGSVEGVLMSISKPPFGDIFKGYKDQEVRALDIMSDKSEIIQSFRPKKLHDRFLDKYYEVGIDEYNIKIKTSLNSSTLSKSQRDLFIQNMIILFVLALVSIFILRKFLSGTGYICYVVSAPCNGSMKNKFKLSLNSYI